jgi:hypothetical protein
MKLTNTLEIALHSFSSCYATVMPEATSFTVAETVT